MISLDQEAESVTLDWLLIDGQAYEERRINDKFLKPLNRYWLHRFAIDHARHVYTDYDSVRRAQPWLTTKLKIYAIRLVCERWPQLSAVGNRRIKEIEQDERNSW